MAVSAGDKVVLTGFGIFEALKTAERQGRNPQTGTQAFRPTSPFLPHTTAVRFSLSASSRDLRQNSSKLISPWL